MCGWLRSHDRFSPLKIVCGLDFYSNGRKNENGILFQDKIGVLTPDLDQLVNVLHDRAVTEVCMESTSIYWMPVWRILEPYFSLKLVNPYFTIVHMYQNFFIHSSVNECLGCFLVLAIVNSASIYWGTCVFFNYGRTTILL